MAGLRGRARRSGQFATARLTIKEAKAGFFRVGKTMSRMERIAFKVNKRYGGYVRKVARNSMKRVRRRTSLNQLSPEQLADYNAARRRWHKGGRRWREPQLPPEPSRPGEAPGVVAGQLKKFLFYVQHTEYGRPSVIIGPVRLEGGSRNKGEVPSLHENSGTGLGSGFISVRFPQRPYMGPAAEKAIPQVPSWLRQAAVQAR